jgi:hypothetical protein
MGAFYAPQVPGLTPSPQFVFAYGSLVTDAPGAVPAVLPGHRRAWTVAMDNRRSLPGYKRFRARDGVTFPPVFVAFLDLADDPANALDGLCLPVTAAALDALDRRERNYDRVDVTPLVDGPQGRIWTYRGSADGRARAAAGLADGSLAVARGYADAVRAGYAGRGPALLERFDASTDAPPCPVLDLVRVDLPPA